MLRFLLNVFQSLHNGTIDQSPEYECATCEEKRELKFFSCVLFNVLMSFGTAFFHLFMGPDPLRWML